MKAVFLLAALAWASPAFAGEPPDVPSGTGPQAPVTQATIDKLLAVIAAHEARIEELEKKVELEKEVELEKTPGDTGSGVPSAAEPRPSASAAAQNVAPPPPPEAPVQQPADHLAQTQDTAVGGHNMALPGGPVLNIRGFF